MTRHTHTYIYVRAINVRLLLVFSTLQHAREYAWGTIGTVKENLLNNQLCGGGGGEKLIAPPMNEKKEAMNF